MSVNFKDKLHIWLDDVKDKVFNIFGQKVLSQYNINKINISNLKSGMYFIKINSNQTLKFIKQ
mgnify:CR=1 FL=1